MPVLRIPTPLRAYTSGQSEVTVSGANISEALADLTNQFPTISRICLMMAGNCVRLLICSLVNITSRICRAWIRRSRMAIG